MGTKLFDRRATLIVSTIRIELLRFAFAVTKTTKPEPNKASIKIWNLNAAHREQLQALSGESIPVQLSAGYVDGVSQIFSGALRRSFTLREGPDLVTTIESGDGTAQHVGARVSVSVAKGAGNRDILRAVAAGVGVLPGNIEAAIAKLGGASYWANGGVFFGSATEEMTRICRSLDLEWSVQDGKLQVLERGKALDGKAIRLSKETGMIGEPTEDAKGVVSVKMLLQPDVFPGRLVVIDGARLKANVKLEQTVHSGDSRTDAPWQVDGQGKRY